MGRFVSRCLLILIEVIVLGIAHDLFLCSMTAAAERLDSEDNHLKVQPDVPQAMDEWASGPPGQAHVVEPKRSDKGSRLHRRRREFAQASDGRAQRRTDAEFSEAETSLDGVARKRDYLNGLVAASAAKSEDQACNIAFAKTHKTASTTMAMILVRYARRHDKKLASFGGNHVSSIPLEEAVRQVKASGERVDVMHYHYTDFGYFQRHWHDAVDKYAQIMREGEDINFITVLRSPRSHFLSFYYFYVQPEVKLSVEHFYRATGSALMRQRKRLENPMCLEFGIRTEDDLDTFILEELPKFRLVILTEEFDEGLMVLRRLMGWDMIDMTYARMMTNTAGTHRWDGKELTGVPSFDSLPDEVQDGIDQSTRLDKKLYDAAAELYYQRKDVAAVEIAAELEEFHTLQNLIGDYLHDNKSSEAKKWYSGGVQPYKGGPPFYPFR